MINWLLISLCCLCLNLHHCSSPILSLIRATSNCLWMYSFPPIFWHNWPSILIHPTFSLQQQPYLYLCMSQIQTICFPFLFLFVFFSSCFIIFLPFVFSFALLHILIFLTFFCQTTLMVFSGAFGIWSFLRELSQILC